MAGAEQTNSEKPSPAPTRKKFLACLAASELVDSSRIERWLADQPADAGSRELATALVRASLTTPWQAEKLLKGRCKGFHLGAYTLQRRIGSGGMSTVYLALRREDGLRVAVKVLPPARAADPVYLKRFRAEAQAAALVDDPHVVKALDVECDAATPYFIMEYVEGKTLEKLVEERGPLPQREAGELIRQAALGLAAAHRRSLVHRDVKPANLIRDRRGDVRVLDLGLARFVDLAEASTHDGRRRVVGTADYLAPEQAFDSRAVDARSDVYSLGCTLYFLLSGRPPFPEGTIAEKLRRHQQVPPTPLPALRPGLGDQVVEICAAMMAKRPADRPQSMEELSQLLGGWLEEEISVDEDVLSPSDETRPAAALPPPPPPTRREPDDAQSEFASPPPPPPRRQPQVHHAADVQPSRGRTRSRARGAPAWVWALLLALAAACTAVAARLFLPV